MSADYFGLPWASGVCDEGRQVVTPVGRHCEFCDEAIGPDDQGTFMFGIDGQRQPVHKECSLRMVLGGIGHIEDHAYWCLGRHDPDGGRTRRQSALEVWQWVQIHGIPS